MAFILLQRRNDYLRLGVNVYTAFCNGPDEVKSPYDRHVAELTLLSVVSAEAATLCCQTERLAYLDASFVA